MIKSILTGLLLSFCSLVLAQEQQENKASVAGKIIGVTLPTDSVFFSGGQIDAKYFTGKVLAAELKEGAYQLTKDFAEPVMYRMVLLSDRNQLIWRAGRYFLDNSTSNIISDLNNNECVTVEGITAREYQKEFIPFIFKNKPDYNCNTREMEKLEESKDLRFDTLLYSYVKTHPSSYVALWQLTNRFTRFGHSMIRELTLNSFSNELKSKQIWATLKDDFKNILIREHQPFPAIKVKNTAYVEQRLTIPKAKFTLIDFWFSRCKPCLEAYPDLKRLFDQYAGKGFNIISISTDKTKDTTNWEKRIKDYELNWVHYLDENGTESNGLLIRNFPTTFLLDSKGRIVKRDLAIQDLEDFLKEQLEK